MCWVTRRKRPFRARMPRRPPRSTTPEKKSASSCGFDICGITSLGTCCRTCRSPPPHPSFSLSQPSSRAPREGPTDRQPAAAYPHRDLALPRLASLAPLGTGQAGWPCAPAGLAVAGSLCGPLPTAAVGGGTAGDGDRVMGPHPCPNRNIPQVADCVQRWASGGGRLEKKGGG